MKPSTAAIALVLLTLAVAILFAALAGLVAALLSRSGGASTTRAIIAGATAFAGTLTLIFGALAVMSNLLH